MSEEEFEITVERIKALALASGPVETAQMMMEGGPVLHLLVLAVQMQHQAHEVRLFAADLAQRSSAPEHTELVQSMITAAKAASVAFDAAANAAYQLYWAGENCPCDECVNDRRREAAPLN